MTFKINDRIVHPQHGIGEITKILNEELVEGYDQYYVIDICGQDLTIHVPVVKADELGLRHTMSKSLLENVMAVLRDEPNQLPGDYKIRQSSIRKKLTSAVPVLIAEVVRDLGWRKNSDHLSSMDTNLLEKSRGLLASEIAVVNDVKMEHALRLIDHNIKISFAAAAAESA